MIDVTKMYGKGDGIDCGVASERTSTVNCKVCHRAGTNELALGDKVIQVALQCLTAMVADEAWAMGYRGRILTALTLLSTGEGDGWCSIADVLEHALY